MSDSKRQGADQAASWRKDLPVHPLADEFPSLPHDELIALRTAEAVS